MAEQTKPLEMLVKELPPSLQNEVRDFVESLLAKRARRPKGKFKLEWRGALRDWGAQYTSVELQHQALDWWGH